MDKIRKVLLDETELKQANKYKDEIGSNPIVCRMLVVLNELVEGYNENKRGIGVIKHTLIDMKFYEVTKRLDKIENRLDEIMTNYECLWKELRRIEKHEIIIKNNSKDSKHITIECYDK